MDKSINVAKTNNVINNTAKMNNVDKTNNTNASNNENGKVSSFNQLKNSISKSTEKVIEDTKVLTNQLKEKTSELTEKTPEISNYFSFDFIQTNTMISKFVFILLILIIFVTLFYLGLFILQAQYGTQRTPYILKNMVISNKLYTISSNPNIDNSIPILRSINEMTGIEYTWSVWVYIKDLYLNENTKYKRIFSKGNHNTIQNQNYEEKFINNSPGLYLNNGDNVFTIVFNTHSNNETIYETIEIDNIPIEKWVQCVIRVKHKTVDIFINGILKKSHTLQNVVNQNYYDTFIGDDKGFDGYISKLRYYDYAINDEDIQYDMSSGPNTTMDIQDDKELKHKFPSLSMMWYYN
jgi:hypothetical protein|tara:strand:- start:1194 stop:2246 length:1053 start_codon:yes stop_codon:yes gene_type:complete